MRKFKDSSPNQDKMVRPLIYFPGVRLVIGEEGKFVPSGRWGLKGELDEDSAEHLLTFRPI